MLITCTLLSDLNGGPSGKLSTGFERLSKDEFALWADAVKSTCFARCRWFIHDWTLQELIALSHLVFNDAS